MDSALDAIGNTPLIRLNKIPKSLGIKCEILVKCEYFNAGGSVKDRIGKKMLEDSEKLGILKKGDTLIEPTSGNTGIGLSLAAAIKGYPIIITLPEKMSNEKVDVLKGLGAKVIRTPTEAAFDSPESNIGKACSLLREIPNAHVLNQYKNVGNPLAHYDQTGEEILYQTDKNLKAVIIGTGTGGQITGIGRKIKEIMGNKCTIVGADPIGSILADPEEINPALDAYKVEGVGYDFIPKSLDRSVVDEWFKTTDKESFNLARRLVKEEGLLCGGSSGGVLQAGIEYALKHNLSEKDRIVLVLPDTIRNYITKFLSTEWMVANKFLPYSELNDQESLLIKKSIKDLNLQPVETYTMSLTIQEAIKQFEKGKIALPIVENGVVESVIYQERLMGAVVGRKLQPTDTVYKGCWTKDFVRIEEEVNCCILEKLLQRNPCVIYQKKDEVFEIKKTDILRILF